MNTTPVRIPNSMIERAESLIPFVRAKPEAEVWGVRVAPAVVIRLALQRGLAELEREQAEREHKQSRKQKQKQHDAG